MIEFLNKENIGETMGILKEMHRDSGWKHFPLDEDYLLENMNGMIGKEGCFVCLYRQGGKITGLFIASLAKFFFSKSLVGMESGMYVLPAHRGGRAAVSMYSEFIKWCDANNAEPFIEIFFSDDETNEKTYQFFRKSGMKDCGRMFRRS